MLSGVRICGGRYLVVVGAFFGAVAVGSGLTEPQERKPESKAESTIDFNRQILPLLSENCFACHGPDAGQRKAKLRLDMKEGAFAELRNGGYAIVPGKSSESKMIAKITAVDPKDRMPPAKTGKQLKPEQ